MGNSLTQTPDAPLNESLLNQLKQRSLADVIECLTVLKEDYPDCQCVTYDQFSDIFGPLVDDPEPFFLMLQNNRDISGVVDVYEALAVFAIFSKDRYERKGRFIFELFDFDHNKHLDLAELTLTMQAVARGLCKAVHITPPSRESIKEECKSIFRLVDQSGDGKVSVAELRMYVKHNAELQEFLLKYAEIQTFANIKARFDKREIEYLSFFDRAVESNDLVGARVGILKNLIEQREKSVKLPDIELLLDIMLNTTVLFTRGGVSKDEGLIIKEAYEPIMKAWCAYLASDFNHNNILEASELHALLWLYEGKEPNQERINFEMGEMGKKDLDGILIGDFLKNLCVMDKNGNYALRPTLKKLFEKYDKDGSGYLSFDELKAIIYESFEGYAVRQESQKVRDDIEEIVKGLTKEIFKELDRNGSTNIAWDEFKKFMEVSLPKIDKLRLFLDMNLE